MRFVSFTVLLHSRNSMEVPALVRPEVLDEVCWESFHCGLFN